MEDSALFECGPASTPDVHSSSDLPSRWELGVEDPKEVVPLRYRGLQETPSVHSDPGDATIGSAVGAGPALLPTGLESHTEPPCREWTGGGKPVGLTSALQVVAKEDPQVGPWEITLDGPGLIHELEQLNEQLVRRGFPRAPHRLETQLGPSGTRTVPKVDLRALWSLCSEILEAYDQRGRRLQEALLAERAEDRTSRDSRIQTLLNQNSQLQEQVKALRSSSSARSTSCSEASSPNKPDRGHREPAGDLLQQALVRAKTAEASARQREHELERLRERLAQLAAEESKRRAKEAAALCQPLRRGTASGRDDRRLLDAALSHKARADSLHMEAASLAKKVRECTLRLDESERRSGLLEAAHTPPVDLMETAREQEIRARALEQVRELSAKHTAEVATLQEALCEARAYSQRLEVECMQHLEDRTRPHPEPDIRWQREALRLREELADMRRQWRASDPRELMRRDKDLRRLGLDARSIEETASKSELVALLLDICRVLNVGEVTEIPAVIRARCSPGRETEEERLAAADFAREAMEVLRDLDGSPAGHEGRPLQPREALGQLRSLCAEEAHRRQVAEPRHSEEAVCALAEVLDMSQGFDVDLLISRVKQLRFREELLCSVGSHLQCNSLPEIPQQLDALIKVCDMRMAAQRIVSALQDLLHVSSLTEVLPALKGVIDLGALRRLKVTASQNSRAADKRPGGSTGGT